MALKIESNNFDQIIENTSQPVLVDFWAAWCGPCQVLGPTIDELAEDYDGKAVIGKVNVDDNPGLAQRFGVRSIPTLLFFKDGKPVGQIVGVASKVKIANVLDEIASGVTA